MALELTEQEEALNNLLTQLSKDYIKDEEGVRDRYVQEVRRNNLYFNGIQNIFNTSLDGSVGDWSTFNDYVAGLDEDFDIDDTEFDQKFINVYKAYVESLVAALSSQLPSTRFFPDNADNSDDVNTAQSFEKILPLIRRHNKSKILLLQVINIFINEGVVAVRNYVDSNEKYGFADKPVKAKVVRQESILYCPNCNTELGSNNTSYEFNPNEEFVERDSTETEEMALCPTCADSGIDNGLGMPGVVNPISDNSRTAEDTIVDIEEVPKVRAKFEAYGLTNVRFPAYCTDQESIPCLVLEREQSIALVLSVYKHLRDKINENPVDNLETTKWARRNPFYTGESPKYTCTVRDIWIRPWALARVLDSKYGFALELPEEELVEGQEPKTVGDYLQELYPNGVRVVLVNDEFAEAIDESLDEHWTISVNPLYKHLICKSIGSSLIAIQDLENDNIAITEQTIEHGVTETFVDSDTLDLAKYSEGEIRPGNITSVKRTDPAKSIGDSFFQTRPAALSQEVGIFGNRINEKGQFVSGASPSIYGGSMEGSETAAVYSMSRAQALQRLTIPWHIICELWSEMEFKAILDYVANLNYDESYPVKQGNSYSNVYIQQIRLQGKVSCVEPESDGYFPVSWSQERDMVSTLLTLNNDAVNEILFHPENRSLIAKLAGPKDLYIPGDDARKKQMAEIAEMLKAAPVTMDQMTGAPLPEPQSSVQVDPEMDDHEVEFEIIKVWVTSADGQYTKKSMPDQYMNILLHGKMHKMFVDMAAQEAQAAEAEQGNNVDAPKGKANA